MYATGTHLHGAETGRGDSPSAVGVSQRGRTERREGVDGVRSIDIRGRDAEWWSRRSSQLPTATSRAGGRAGFTANAAGAQVAARLHAAWTSSGAVRQATIGLSVALAYYAGARLGFLLVFPGSPLSVIWPPNAIVLAALLLVPPRAWWIVLLGVLPAHLIVEWQSGVVPLAVPGLYVTNCGEALLGATIVRRLSGGGPPWLGTLQQVVVYVVGAAIAAPFVASFLDTSVVEVTHWAAPGEYWLLWEQRFISAVLTNLTVAPVILLLACGGWRQYRTLPRRRRVEAALLALSILGSSYLAFSPRTVLPRDTPELLYLLVPVLLWAAVHFGVGGISTSLLAVALLAAGWADASGLFVARAPAAAVVTLQLFLIALGAPALCLAGLVKEREGARAEAERQAAQLDRIFEGMAEGLVVHDAQGLTVRTNASARRLLGLDAAPPGFQQLPLRERLA
ncbi:MAG TPA: MASE1 domain-containing protein, partial [Ktedonobacterales bacterium]|nr:MASE1 domain-containing protein [Ktedonobacterales bacterium]